MVGFAWLLFSGRLQSEVSLLGSFIPTSVGSQANHRRGILITYHSNFNYFIYSRCASVALLSVRGTGENGWEANFCNRIFYLTPNFFDHLRDLQVAGTTIGA